MTKPFLLIQVLESIKSQYVVLYVVTSIVTHKRIRLLWAVNIRRNINKILIFPIQKRYAKIRVFLIIVEYVVVTNIIHFSECETGISAVKFRGPLSLNW